MKLVMRRAMRDASELVLGLETPKQVQIPRLAALARNDYGSPTERSRVW